MKRLITTAYKLYETVQYVYSELQKHSWIVRKHETEKNEHYCQKLGCSNTRDTHVCVCVRRPAWVARCQPSVMWCRCSDCLRSVVGPSTFLDLGSGMDCPKTSFQHWHLQVSGADLNPSSSSSHILIVSSNCTFDTLVVLVVTFII